MRWGPSTLQVAKPQYYEKTQTLVYSKGCALDALQRVTTKDAAGSTLVWPYNDRDALVPPPPAAHLAQSKPPQWIENDRKVGTSRVLCRMDILYNSLCTSMNSTPGGSPVPPASTPGPGKMQAEARLFVAGVAVVWALQGGSAAQSGRDISHPPCTHPLLP